MISTRAASRAATYMLTYTAWPQWISTRAASRAATEAICSAPSAICYFYPRRLTGGDVTHAPYGKISIFLPAPPHGRRQIPRVTIPQDKSISTRAASRAATQRIPISISAAKFLPAPPHGRRPWLSCAPAPGCNFYPRRLTGGDREKTDPPITYSQFLPAPPHGRRPSSQVTPFIPFSISTRAASRAATLCGAATQIFTILFLPAPPHGRRPHFINEEDGILRFLPAPPHGRRLNCTALLYTDIVISTRAASRAATIIFIIRNNSNSNFYPRRLTGGDPTSSMRRTAFSDFYPRRLTGGD